MRSVFALLIGFLIGCMSIKMAISVAICFVCLVVLTSVMSLLFFLDLFKSTVCRLFGHRWKEVGGRKCMRSTKVVDCSQPVYVCTWCGRFDYGDPDGPGWEACQGCRTYEYDISDE